jgi:hypothetical protein
MNINFFLTERGSEKRDLPESSERYVGKLRSSYREYVPKYAFYCKK